MIVQSTMKDEGKIVSINKLCDWFRIPRSSFYYKPKKRKSKAVDPILVHEIWKLIIAQPTWGVRFITAAIRRSVGLHNHKKIHRIIKLNGWQIHKKAKGNRPRVKSWPSRALESNLRWAVDTTHILCGSQGWAHLTAIIDCCDRSILGWRLSLSGSAKVAAAALEDALRARGIKPGTKRLLSLRSDNGLVFGSKEFTRLVHAYGLSQEYITPYTPEQNGIIERFFRTMKEECIWGHNFNSIDEAFKVIADWMDHYHGNRPHSALGYKTPNEFIATKLSA